MKLTTTTPALPFIVLALALSLAGCGWRQKSTSRVPDAEFARYVQKYPKMGEAVRKGYLSKDAAYSLRVTAPQEQIMDQYKSNVTAKGIEISARHIPVAEKHRLIREYMRQNEMRYVNAANAAGKQAEQEEKTLGHSPFAR